MEEKLCKCEVEDTEAGPSQQISQSAKILLEETDEFVEAYDVSMKKRKLERKIRIAVSGCSHGEMDKIYACAAEIEKREGWKFDLMICTGDYQAVRNRGDLEHMNVPPKYRSLQTFHRYYSEEVVAPILTLVVGGNHEASGYMQELPYGGWIAPRIYYLGHAAVVTFAGLRIAGISGIYNSAHYDVGHFERPPFMQHGSVISVYHVRSIDVFRLKQLEPRKESKEAKKIDIMVSHDWPSGITDYGDVDKLLRIKPHFADDIRKSVLGNPATMNLLHQIRPRYWLSSHLHCAFAALVPHGNLSTDIAHADVTYFLALDKPIPNRQFLQALEIEIEDDAELVLKYDPTWLAILKSSDSLTSASNRRSYMPSAYPPSDERWDYRPTHEELSDINKLFKNDFVIPQNFQRTAPPHKVFQTMTQGSEFYYRNPQTTTFCMKLGIKDLNGMLCALSPDHLGTPYFLTEGNTSQQNEELQITAEKSNTGDCFFIDKTPMKTAFEEAELKSKFEQSDKHLDKNSDLQSWIEEVVGDDHKQIDKVGSGNFKRRFVDIPDED